MIWILQAQFLAVYRSEVLSPLLLHRAFSRFTEYYTPTNALTVYHIIYYWYSAVGPVWAETRAQSRDWYGSGTLHHGQVLRGSLPLLSPAFLDVPTFHDQVPPRPPRRERFQRRKWELWAC